MRKPAFCIFCGLCILTLFSLLTVNVRGGGGGGGGGGGVSNNHCLLPFFIFVRPDRKTQRPHFSQQGSFSGKQQS